MLDTEIAQFSMSISKIAIVQYSQLCTSKTANDCL